MIGNSSPDEKKVLGVLLTMCSELGGNTMTYQRIQNEVPGLERLAVGPGMGLTLDSVAPLLQTPHEPFKLRQARA